MVEMSCLLNGKVLCAIFSRNCKAYLVADCGSSALRRRGKGQCLVNSPLTGVWLRHVNGPQKPRCIPVSDMASFYILKAFSKSKVDEFLDGVDDTQVPRAGGWPFGGIMSYFVLAPRYV